MSAGRKWGGAKVFAKGICLASGPRTARPGRELRSMGIELPSAVRESSGWCLGGGFGNERNLVLRVRSTVLRIIQTEGQPVRFSQVLRRGRKDIGAGVERLLGRARRSDQGVTIDRTQVWQGGLPACRGQTLFHAMGCPRRFCKSDGGTGREVTVSGSREHASRGGRMRSGA